MLNCQRRHTYEDIPDRDRRKIRADNSKLDLGGFLIMFYRVNATKNFEVESGQAETLTVKVLFFGNLQLKIQSHIF